MRALLLIAGAGGCVICGARPASAQELRTSSAVRLGDRRSPLIRESAQARAPCLLRPNMRSDLRTVYSADGQDENQAEPGHTSRALLAGAGILVGGVGVLGGAFLGRAIAGGGSWDEQPGGWVPFYLGLGLGESLGMSSGVHLANGRQGSFLRNWLTTFTIAAVIGPLAGATESPVVVAVGVCLIQLPASVATEIRSAQRSSRGEIGD